MNRFLISIAVLLAGCTMQSNRLTLTAGLTDSMRHQVSRTSFERPVAVDLLGGQRLYLSRITFHADSLYFCSHREGRVSQERVNPVNFRPIAAVRDDVRTAGCDPAKATDAGGALALSDVARVGYEPEPDSVIGVFAGILIGVFLAWYELSESI
ncbi:MAG TPA: hypothetical protein VGA18_04600 [Rhodothermales bacterium]